MVWFESVIFWCGSAVALGSLWLLGALVLSLAGVRAEDGGERIVSEFAAGVGLLAVVGTVVVISGFTLTAPAFYGVAIVLALPVWRRRRTVGVSLRLPGDRVARAVIFSAGLVAITIIGVSTQDQLWWDGWAIWAFKARVLFIEGTLPARFVDPAGPYAFTHLSYPLGVPLASWWVYRHAGAAVPALTSLLGAVWMVLLALLLWSALRRHIGERVAALAALGILVFWPLVLYATGGTADVVIALALLGAVIGIVDGIGGDDAALWRSGVFLLLGAMSKNEGTAIAVVALPVAGVALWRVRRPLQRRGLPVGEKTRVPAVLPFLLPFVALAPWLIFVRLRGLQEQVVTVAREAGGLGLGERAALLSVVFEKFLLSGPWLPLPCLAAIGVLSLWLSRDRAPAAGRALTAGWVLVAGYLTTLCVVYLLTPQDLIWLLVTTLPRVLGPFVAVVIYLALRSAALTASPLTPRTPALATDSAPPRACRRR